MKTHHLRMHKPPVSVFSVSMKEEKNEILF